MNGPGQGPELHAELHRALAVTRAQLAEADTPQPPPELVHRWHAALAELPPPAAGPPGGARTRSPRRFATLAAALATSAAAVALTVALTAPDTVPLQPVQNNRGEPASMALNNDDPRDLGELADPVRLAGCLARVGQPAAMVLDRRRVRWHDAAAVRLVLPTGTPGQVRALVVTPDCGPDTGRLLSDTPLGR